VGVRWLKGSPRWFGTGTKRCVAANIPLRLTSSTPARSLERNTSPERLAESGDRTRFFDRVREGRIEICALPFSMNTEAYSIDELARQLRFADELRGRFDVPIETAMQIDVPGATIGLLTSLVDADIR
jgi:RNase H-fold protein (predicted Holliday junction resolvase)